MIDATVKSETRSLYGYQAFRDSLAPLQQLVATRCKAILEHESMQGPWPSITKAKGRIVKGRGGSFLEVTAAVGPEVEIAAATLHWQLRRPGPFVAVPMKRTESGTFVAHTQPQKPGERIRYYVEVRAKSGRLAFAPAGASSKAKRVRFPKK